MQADSQVDRPTSSLLDRLISSDDSDVSSVSGAPGVASPGLKINRRRRARQMSILRAQIERDLLALLGTRQMMSEAELKAWPLVESSVLNYGIPDLSGTTASSIDTGKLQKTLARIIRRFEPRLHPDSVSVSCRVGSPARNDVRVEIEALFGPEDALESFAMGVSICLGSGHCSVDGRPSAA